MGAIVNGLTLHYLRGYGVDVPDVQRLHAGSIRLAALMELPSIFVFTHDSIGLGEDGPTHQPIEQLAGLRAMPDLRWSGPPARTRPRSPGDYAIASTDHPSAIVCSRQGVPTWNPAGIPPTRSSVARTCCATRTTSPSRRELILIATGTEVHICARAADLLEADGIATRLVSMPCMEHFAAQDAEYRDSVLPPSVRARVSLEAASHVRLAPLGRRPRRGDRDGGIRRLRTRERPLQALRIHARAGRGRRPRRRQARAPERSRRDRRDRVEHRHRAESPVVSDNRGGRASRRRPPATSRRAAHGLRRARRARGDPAQAVRA